jgi:hypothetical protein
VHCAVFEYRLLLFGVRRDCLVADEAFAMGAMLGAAVRRKIPRHCAVETREFPTPWYCCQSRLLLAVRPSDDAAAPLISETIDEIQLALDRNDLMASLGYPAAQSIARELPRQIEPAILLGWPYLRPRATYSIYGVQSQSALAIRIGGVSITGQIGGFLQGASRVGVFVVTVGQEISLQSEAATTSGDLVSSWALDGLGSWAAEATAQALMVRLESHLAASESISMRYSPGYCGMNLAQQRAIFQLVQAAAVGVTLLPSMLMQPMKSVSGLVGMGSDLAFGDARSPCEQCQDLKCRMRR